MENLENQRSIKDVLMGANCYIGNLEELTEEVADVLVEDADGKVVLDFKGGVSLLQVLWDKFKETAQECAGKEIKVVLPDGLVGQILGAALGLIGFRL